MSHNLSQIGVDMDDRTIALETSLLCLSMDARSRRGPHRDKSNPFRFSSNQKHDAIPSHVVDAYATWISAETGCDLPSL